MAFAGQVRKRERPTPGHCRCCCDLVPRHKRRRSEGQGSFFAKGNTEAAAAAARGDKEQALVGPGAVDLQGPGGADAGAAWAGSAGIGDFEGGGDKGLKACFFPIFGFGQKILDQSGPEREPPAWTGLAESRIFPHLVDAKRHAGPNVRQKGSATLRILLLSCLSIGCRGQVSGQEVRGDQHYTVQGSKKLLGSPVVAACGAAVGVEEDRLTAASPQGKKHFLREDSVTRDGNFICEPRFLTKTGEVQSSPARCLANDFLRLAGRNQGFVRTDRDATKTAGAFFLVENDLTIYQEQRPGRTGIEAEPAIADIEAAAQASFPHHGRRGCRRRTESLKKRQDMRSHAGAKRIL